MPGAFPAQSVTLDEKFRQGCVIYYIAKGEQLFFFFWFCFSLMYNLTVYSKAAQLTAELENFSVNVFLIMLK